MKKEKHSAMRYFRWTAILLCLIGITACRQDTPRFRIGVAQCSDDSWRHKMNDEILREAMFYDGVSVEIRSAGDDNRRQAEDIHYFMDKGVDLLIISANEAAPMTPIVEEAYRKGIPVITVDRKILSDKYTAYIGADNYEIGRAVGNYIASRLKGKGNIVELTGLSGSTPAMERHQGFMAAISHFPEIKLIDKADAAWERGPAEVEMDSMLRRHSKICLLYTSLWDVPNGLPEDWETVKADQAQTFGRLMPISEWSMTIARILLLPVWLLPTNSLTKHSR